jgi:hypothetical protein
MRRRAFLKTAAALGVCASLPQLSGAVEKPGKGRLFPTGLGHCQWGQFGAAGFSAPACGVIYGLKDKVTNGMALGGIDTGCFDLETSGMLGYNTIFNTLIPRRGPDNWPLLGLSAGGKTWVLCDHSQAKTGWGDYQYSEPGKKFTVWKDQKYERRSEPLLPPLCKLNLAGVQTAKEIRVCSRICG